MAVFQLHIVLIVNINTLYRPFESCCSTDDKSDWMAVGWMAYITKLDILQIYTLMSIIFIIIYL
jgi:hypothetical protein